MMTFKGQSRRILVVAIARPPQLPKREPSEPIRTPVAAARP
jgi:hypothetical protein